jgi:hypothetical protein
MGLYIAASPAADRQAWKRFARAIYLGKYWTH